VILIRELQVKDVTLDYIEWFNNPAVIRFSDNQYRKFSIEAQREYVKNCELSQNAYLYAIFSDQKLIGNIKLSNISTFHRRAEISYVIGNQDYWGKGIAKVAISEIIKKAKLDFNLYKLFAGVASENISSIRVLEKNDFVLEGRRKDHLFYNGTYYDQLDYGLIIY
tara:strand:+ start:154 stop:651 length:498 start_codon:yes stop_codon:yes gene_type:complete